MKQQLCLLAAVVLCGITAAHPQTIPDHYNLAEDTWTVGSSDYIKTPGIPPCAIEGDQKILSQRTAAVAAAATKLASAAATGATIPWGSVFVIGTNVWEQVGGKAGGSGAELLDRVLRITRYATCVQMAVAIPASATIIHMNFLTTEDGNDIRHDTGAGCGNGRFKMGDPDENFSCAVGWAQFDRPITVTRGSVTVVSVVFRNWSHNRVREAMMQVLWYYKSQARVDQE